MAPLNIHGVGLVVEGRGVLIRGPSGSGKTALALALLAHCRVHARSAALVADDQLFVTPHHGRLVADAPPAILGLVEARGLGPTPIAAARRMVVDLVVDLIAVSEVPRHADAAVARIGGIDLPSISLARRDRTGSVHAIAAWLSLPPFSPPASN